MEEKECPSCKTLNPVTRVTCQSCHAKLTGKNPFEGKQEVNADPNSNPSGEKTNGTRRQRKIRKPRTPKEPSPEIIEETPPKPHIRKKRQTKPKSLSMQYFALAGQTLVPILINLQVKPINKKDLTPEGKSLVSLWNRNKTLLK